MDCEADRRAHLKKRLSIYKLRARAELAEADDLCVYALLGVRALGLIDLPALEGCARPLGDGVAFTDPRLGWLGARAILPRETAEARLADAGFHLGETAAFDRLRLSLGVPEGSGDLEPEKATLIESGFDELRGIDWNKGCFLGQELTARMKYRGLAKKRLIPVEIEGPTPEPGTQIRNAGKPAGTLRSAVDGVGLALIRLDKLESGTPMAAGEATLTPRKPDWANF
jgi:folate-binding protein YgfZ